MKNILKVVDRSAMILLFSIVSEAACVYDPMLDKLGMHYLACDMQFLYFLLPAPDSQTFLELYQIRPRQDHKSVQDLAEFHLIIAGPQIHLHSSNDILLITTLCLKILLK